MTTLPPMFESLLESPHLPSVPAVAVRLLQIARDPDTDTPDVVDAIRTDPALAAKILRSANSSYFSFRSEITSLERAVPLIGRTVISSLALSFSLSSETMQDNALTPHYRRYWLQSIVHASAAETLSKFAETGPGSELFMAGLLLDLGRLALLKVAGPDYLPVLEQWETGQSELHGLETASFGFNHVDAGVELMTRWKLPQVMVEATRLHHAEFDELDAAIEDLELARALIMAARVGDYFCGPNPGEALAQLRTTAYEFFGLDEDTLLKYLEETDQAIQRTAELLNTDTSDLSCPADLMAQACQQLVEITIRQDREHQDLREQALLDPLTGLYNRRYFDEAVRNQVRQASRTATVLGVLFLDADHFKQLNDNCGHQFGDKVLQRIAELLNEQVRESDIAARYGGEEFVVLTVDTSEAGLKVMAERIRRTIEAEIMRHKGEIVPVTVSIGGVVTVPGRKEIELEKRLVETADSAMYESKRNGRNRITVYSLSTELDETLARLVDRYRFSRWLVERGVVLEADLADIVEKPCGIDGSIGQLAVQKGWITPADVMQILEDQSHSAERFGSIACRLELLTHSQLAELLADQQEDATVVAMRLVKRNLLAVGEVKVLLDCFREDIKRRFTNTAAANEPVAPALA